MENSITTIIIGGMGMAVFFYVMSLVATALNGIVPF